MPLPSFLLILALPALILLALRNRSHPSAAPAPRSVLSKTVRWIYRVLLLALLAMDCLEVARLATSDSGVGLLPVGIAGVLVVMGLEAVRSRTSWLRAEVISVVLVTYWVLCESPSCLAGRLCESAKLTTLVGVVNSGGVPGYQGKPPSASLYLA